MVAFTTSAVPMVFSSALGDFCLGSSACTFQFIGSLFLYFFKTFQTLGLGVNVRVAVGF